MADSVISKQELIDAQKDAQTLEEVVNEKKIVNPRYGAPFKSLPLVVEELSTKADEVIAQGFYTGYATETALKASLPSVSEMRARADDTRKIWRWNRTSAEGVTPVTGTWTDTGLSDLDQANRNTNEMISRLSLKKSDDQSIICFSADANGNALIWIDKETGIFNAAGLKLSVYTPINQLKPYYNSSVIAGAVDQNGNVIWGVDKTTGKFFAAGLDSVGSLVQTKTYKYFAQKPLASEINHMLSYGESLSVGATATTIISTTQPYFNTTFNTSPRQDTAATSVVPLVEQFAVMSSDGYPNNRGETHCSGAANYASLELLKNGISPNSHNIFASTAGQGGATVAALAKGGIAYTRLLDHIAKAKELNVGKTYKAFFVPFIIGTNDAAAATSYSSFRTKLEQVCTDINVDIKAASGQSEDVVFAITQVSYGAKTQPQMAKALLDLANEDERFLFTTPLYHLPYSEGIHLTNAGYKWLGAYIGRVYAQYFNEGRYPDYIKPLSAYIDGSKIIIKFDVPTLPLRIDTTTLASTTNAGFKVMDGLTEIAISSVTASDDSVILQLSSTPTSAVNVRYALDYLGSSLNITNGASGNLRDSTTDSVIVVGVEKPLYHVCPHFEITAYLDKGI